ncbi:unnamed protein product, partial [Brenthis ino]
MGARPLSIRTRLIASVSDSMSAVSLRALGCSSQIMFLSNSAGIAVSVVVTVVVVKDAPGDAGDSQLMSAKGVGRSVRVVGERGGRGAD